MNKLARTEASGDILTENLHGSLSGGRSLRRSGYQETSTKSFLVDFSGSRFSVMKLS